MKKIKSQFLQVGTKALQKRKEPHQKIMVHPIVVRSTTLYRITRNTTLKTHPPDEFGSRFFSCKDNTHTPPSDEFRSRFFSRKQGTPPSHEVRSRYFDFSRAETRHRLWRISKPIFLAQDRYTLNTPPLTNFLLIVLPNSWFSRQRGECTKKQKTATDASSMDRSRHLSEKPPFSLCICPFYTSFG